MSVVFSQFHASFPPVAPWTVQYVCNQISNTTILVLKYRFPSDQRSQRDSGLFSSRLGDDLRTAGVVFFCFLPSEASEIDFTAIFAFLKRFATKFERLEAHARSLNRNRCEYLSLFFPPYLNLNRSKCAVIVPRHFRSMI